MAETKNKAIFEDDPVPRALRAMAVPTVFSQIILLIYNLADTFFVGRTNDPYMVAGASLILPVFNICLSLAGLTGVGGGALLSRLLGEGRIDEAKKVAAFSFYLSIGITGLFSIGMFLFMTPILTLLGAGENTFFFARQYAFCVIVLGGVPTVLSNVMSNLLRSAGYSKEAGFGITMGGLVNIALDPLFMFLILPRGEEMLGVGIATLISNCLSCVYFLAVIFRERKVSPVTLDPRAGLPEKRSVGSVFSVGVPSAVTTLLFDLDYVIIDKLMVAYGDLPLAAVGIVLKAERLPLNVGVGICQGMMPLVAYNYSAGNHRRMRDVIRFSIKVGLLIGVVSVTLYELFARQIMLAFIGETQTVALGTDFLRARVLATPLMFMSFFTVFVFQGFGEGNRSLFLGVTRWLAFNIPMLFLLDRWFGMYGVVWSQVTADTLTVLLSAFVYFRYMKRFPLPSVVNFRVLGGGGKDGPGLADGRFLRSAALSRLSKKDAQTLQNVYGLRTVIDLRTETERRQKPDRTIPGVQTLHIPIFTEAEMGVTREREMDRKQMLEHLPDLKGLYVKMVTDPVCVASLRRIFAVLSNREDGAVLWHCTAGKDRCGLVSALLLSWYGVPEDEIFSDYLATNAALRSTANRYYALVLLLTRKPSAARRVRALYRADRDCLQAAFDAIDAQYGSRDRFLRTELKLDEAVLPKRKEQPVSEE